jgi:hypothetical protein
MKKFDVLLKKDTGIDEHVFIEAANSNDARWAGRKMPNVYEAVVFNSKAFNGGTRPGAGRKAQEKTVTTGFRVHEESLNIIRAEKFPINREVNALVKRIAEGLRDANNSATNSAKVCQKSVNSLPH